jgi:hypothetical protein
MWSKISLGLGTVILVLIAGFYWYFNWSQSQLTTLRENNAKLEIAVSTNEQTIASLRSDFARVGQVLNETNRELSETRIQNRDLQTRLSEHDLGALAEAKPGLVENAINGGTENALRCFELLSGAPLNERERNARNAQVFNRECPWLYVDTLDR